MIRILTVDDNYQNLYLLEAIFKGEGFEVVSAENGAVALDLAKKNPPVLVLSDILMPVMDGFELCRKWKADEELRHIPFLFYTATYTDHKDEEFALSLGADRFILKPQTPERLHQIVREILESLQHGTFIPSVPVEKKEGETLQDYNEILFHKLEKKVSELEIEISNRTRAEEEVRRLNDELEERVRERTLQLESVNRELEAFSYSVSHDLRAPLRHITGFINILRDRIRESLDTDSLKDMEIIEKSALNMSKLIDDLLSFSRVSHQNIVETQFELDTLVQEIVDIFKMETIDRNIEWKIGSLPRITADKAMIRLVMTNLISNAVKYTRLKQVARIEIRSLPEKDNEEIFLVRDNGTGFDMNLADKLFHVFQRLHRSEDFEGTGVGLASVQRIIAKHGGRVWAESEIDKGASFYFSLPKKV